MTYVALTLFFCVDFNLSYSNKHMIFQVSVKYNIWCLCSWLEDTTI